VIQTVCSQINTNIEWVNSLTYYIRRERDREIK